MFQLLGEVIRQERKALGLSQQELGDLAGTGLNFISQLERGKESVRMDKVLSVLKVLGLGLLITRSKEQVALATELQSL